MTAISLAVEAIPEGLPAIVTVVLALGMQRMVGKNALIRKLHAVETLGSTTVICSDKTGTLTQNQMTVTRVYTAGRLFSVSGAGYNPEGAFHIGGRPVDPRGDADLGMLLRGGLLCSDARLRADGDGAFSVVGDPTEGALVVAAAKGGYDREATAAAFPRVREIPFDSDRKLMTTIHAADGRFIAFVKGAPDILLTRAGRILENGEARQITGTDVTKGTADMVLPADNFASIVAAVEEGRVIFANIRKCVFFLLSCNLAEIMIIFFAILLGWPIPLLPIHLLWLNLVTDAFPAFALGMENKEPDVMKVAPRDPRESIINRGMRLMIALQSTVMTVAVLGAFRCALGAGLELDAARTVAFATLIISELLRSFSTRSERHSLLTIGVFGNRYLNAGIAASFALLLLALYSPLGGVLRTVPAGAGEWAIIAAFAVLPLLAGEAGKKLFAAGGKPGK